MEEMRFNRCQSSLEELELSKYPKEVQDQFFNFINNVPFIKWMVSPDRPLISELPRDEFGKAIIDITKPPILEGSNYFRQAALTWQETGKYTHLKPNINPNSDFGKWLTEERRRGWDGLVNPDTGMWITGDYYWMLNYNPIHMVVKQKNGLEIRATRHPKFWDGQFLISHYVWQSRQNGHHSAYLSSRGKGKTSYASSMLDKRFIIGESSENRTEVQCLVTAADRTKLMGSNQILDVFVDGIDFCAKNTYFDSMRLKSSAQEMYWEMGYKTQGSEVAYGSRNSVSGIISGVNQDKLNGSRGVLYLIEEAGIFKNLLNVWSMIRPSVEQGTSVFGQIIAYGTAGDDESDFTSFAEMFYSPDGYNINALENVFDKEGEGRRTCAMFYPAYLNYDDSCMDEDGNSNVTKALLYLLRDRYKVKYGSTDINAITKRISQYPIVPQEAIIRGQFSPFPVTELNERINQLDNNPNEYDDVYVGDLVQDGADIKFVNSIDIPIRDFPHKDNKITGAIEIFEMPQKNLEGKIPAERYISSCLKKGEKVNTVKGLKSVEDVTLEDKLINIDGEEVDIVNLQQYDNVNPVYNVKLYGVYNSTTFSEEHPIYCATPDLRYHHSSVAKRDHIPYRYFAYDFQFKPVKDLHIGDVVKAPNIYRKQKPFLHYWKDEARIDRKIKNPLNNGDFWWLLGLIIGDGWASCNGYSVHISFNAKEVQYIDRARNIVETVFERSFDVCKDLGTCIETSFCCQTFNQFIRDNIGCGAINKQLPEWIKYIPENFKKQLVLGYLASDGSITRNQLEFVSISLKLLNDFQDILFSLGIAGGVSLLSKNSFGQIKGRTVNNQPKYHLRISRTYTQKVKEWDATDIKLQRCSALNLVTIHDYKRMWMSDDLNYIYFKVADIKTEEYVGKVYNFECGTHTFMCNYIPTHNCDPYDNDESNTKSLGSFFVLDTWTDRIVAEYTGRPQFAEDFYEITRKLCLFYNAKVMYENNLMGMYSYYSKRNCVHLLAETPEYLKEKQLITSIGYGNKSCGIRATVPIIKYGFRLIRDWLLKPVTRVEKDAEGNEVEVNTSNLYYIRNRALLKELALWNPYDNFDRIMALVQLMLYREEKMILYQGNMARRDRTVKSFSNDDYWERNYKRNSQKQWADDAENKAQTYIKPDLYQPRIYKFG